MAVAQHDIGWYLDTARDLAASVADATDRIDSERQIPSEIANEIADKGFFRLLMPRSLGGAEMDFPDFLRIVRIFGEVDGSTGWCISQNNVFATHSTRMPEETARQIWSNSRDVVTNGPPASSSRAIPVDGGYRLTGRWNFSSGVRHATWVAALTPIMPRDHNPEESSGQLETRTLLIPKEDVNLIDVWQVDGLRGTGSFSFEVDDLFVPSGRTYMSSSAPRESGPLYVLPTTLLFSSGFATVALGVARSALDATIELAGSKVPLWGREQLRNQPTTQRQIGEAEAIWRSARAFLHESVGTVWDSCCENRSVSTGDRIQLRLASTHAIRTAASVTDTAYNLCGSSAIFASNPVQRRFRDVHVITQQFQGRLSHYDSAGRYYLGLDPDGSL